MDEIDELANLSKPYIVQTLYKLIEIKTVNYNPVDYPTQGPDYMVFPGEEHKIVEFVRKELDTLNVDYQIFNGKERPDLFAFIGQNKKGFKKILLSVHMDTVPSGNAQWKITDPFIPKIKDGKIYGRGAGDDKGPAASLLAAAKILKQHEDKIQGQIILGFNADEEVNLCPGLKKVIQEGSIKVTDAIIPDVCRHMKEIVIGEKGRLLVKVTSHGKSSHASRPHLGKNAIVSLSSLAVLIDRYTLKHDKNPLFADGPTVNIGIMNGGDAPNIVPAIATMTMDIRYLPEQKPSEIINEFERLSLKVDGKFDFEIIGDHKPHVVPKDADMVKVIQKYSDAKLTGIGGGTVSKVLTSLGINAVGFAPGDETVIHGPDEFIEIDELVEYTGIISKISIDVANMKSN